jgi:UDP-N-acetylglucosamine 2-epimerase (non-hydrolysing)
MRKFHRIQNNFMKKIKRKILIVFGTRPEAIKMVPVIKEFEKRASEFEVRVCVTAQHRQMLDQVLNAFGIVPDYDLNIMSENQNLYSITSLVLLGLKEILECFKPDLMLVHGDTTTSMSASIASFYNHTKIGHVEAGLRTNNLQSPWPEEMNRQVIDRICDFYFSPTVQTKQNLLNEMSDENKIFVVGNTVIDTLYMGLDLINNNNQLQNNILREIEQDGYFLKRRDYILVTGHRRENIGNGFINICNALKEIANDYPDLDIVYPVHMNPNVQKTVFELLGEIKNIFLISPLDYLPFIYMMQHCLLILTDSGGVQEEAPSLGKPVLVLREVTERKEAVEAGTVKLVGANCSNITKSVNEILNNDKLYKKMAESHNPYGDGNASKRIVQIISEKL